jgi:hypothetical protein
MSVSREEIQQDSLFEFLDDEMVRRGVRVMIGSYNIIEGIIYSFNIGM